MVIILRLPANLFFFSVGRAMDRRQIILVLEQSLYVLLAQSLLILSNEGGLSVREKQLLRRELGAELGSLTESMRRYMQKGMRGVQDRRSPLTLLTAEPTSSTAPPKSPVQHETSLTSGMSKSDEIFMRYLSIVVQKAFK